MKAWIPWTLLATTTLLLGVSDVPKPTRYRFDIQRLVIGTGRLELGLNFNRSITTELELGLSGLLVHYSQDHHQNFGTLFSLGPRLTWTRDLGQGWGLTGHGTAMINSNKLNTHADGIHWYGQELKAPFEGLSLETEWSISKSLFITRQALFTPKLGIFAYHNKPTYNRMGANFGFDERLFGVKAPGGWPYDPALSDSTRQNGLGSLLRLPIELILPGISFTLEPSFYLRWLDGDTTTSLTWSIGF